MPNSYAASRSASASAFSDVSTGKC
jgi:hypothetical protein